MAKPESGLTGDVLRNMSLAMGEPDWMLDLRLQSLSDLDQRSDVTWSREAHHSFAGDPFPRSEAGDGVGATGDELLGVINGAFERATNTEFERTDRSERADRDVDVGIAESASDSEVALHRNREELERQGVLFTDMATALREHPDLVKPYFGTIVQPNDSTFSLLNTSGWSGGVFIYVPPGVEVDMPLQTSYGVDAEKGQFERTLVVADEGAKVSYIEGCSAPIYTADSLRSSVVEVVVKPGAHVTYATIQNWSSNVFNLVAKGANVEAEGNMTWIDGNIGSRHTMKYPAIRLVGPKATGEVHSVAYAGRGQYQDTGANVIHAAPETSSTIVSRSIAKDGGHSNYRSLVRVEAGATSCESHVRCDALVLDDASVAEAHPFEELSEPTANLRHEATVSTVGDDQLFYLMSRGLSEEQAIAMVVNGFVQPVTAMLPIEYSVELSRLIELQIDGSVG